MFDLEHLLDGAPPIESKKIGGIRTFGLVPGYSLSVDPIGTDRGYLNTDLVKLEVKTRLYRKVKILMPADMARIIGQALIDAASEVYPYIPLAIKGAETELWRKQR